MRFHKLQNVQNALDFLQKERKIKLVNIRPDEIVDGNPKLILGLTWTLILHFQVSIIIHTMIHDIVDHHAASLLEINYYSSCGYGLASEATLVLDIATITL